MQWFFAKKGETPAFDGGEELCYTDSIVKRR